MAFFARWPRKALLYALGLSASWGCAAHSSPTVRERDTNQVQVSAELGVLVRSLRAGTMFIIDGVPQKDSANVVMIRPAAIASLQLAEASCVVSRRCPVLIVTTRNGDTVR